MQWYNYISSFVQLVYCLLYKFSYTTSWLYLQQEDDRQKDHYRLKSFLNATCGGIILDMRFFYPFLHIHVYIYMYIHIYISIHPTHTHTHTHTHTCTHTHTHTHTHTYTHTHTRTHLRKEPCINWVDWRLCLCHSRSLPLFLPHILKNRPACPLAWKHSAHWVQKCTYTHIFICIYEFMTCTGLVELGIFRWFIEFAHTNWHGHSAP